MAWVARRQGDLPVKGLVKRELDDRAVDQLAFPEGVNAGLRLVVVGFELEHWVPPRFWGGPSREPPAFITVYLKLGCVAQPYGIAETPASPEVRSTCESASPARRIWLPDTPPCILASSNGLATGPSPIS